MLCAENCGWLIVGPSSGQQVENAKSAAQDGHGWLACQTRRSMCSLGFP